MQLIGRLENNTLHFRTALLMIMHAGGNGNYSFIDVEGIRLMNTRVRLKIDLLLYFRKVHDAKRFSLFFFHDRVKERLNKK